MEVKMKLEDLLCLLKWCKPMDIHLLTNLLHPNREVLNAQGLDKLGGFVLMIASQIQFFYVLAGSDDDNDDGNWKFHLYLKWHLIGYRFDPHFRLY